MREDSYLLARNQPIKNGILPITLYASELIAHIRRSDSCIIISDTGSGKTTQIPKLIFQHQLHRNRLIGVTQPRRVAAITIADRVAEELGCQIGDTVGYSVRFEDVTSDKTQIKFCTDGMLLRETMLDPLLLRYSFVILDEAHERTVQTDILFGIVKKAQRVRAKSQKLPLKIIVMSATMDVDNFSRYFSNAPVIFVEGRQYNVDVYYTKELFTDYVHAAISAVMQLHVSKPVSEDILVFMTGQDEIEAVVHGIRDAARVVASDAHLLVLPLYASLSSLKQVKVFAPTKSGFRKVIVATNIAETSITIPGIKHVVDSGRCKVKTFSPKTGLDILKVQWISQSQAWQRTGRAGRLSAGNCYRLYTETQFKSLPMYSKPEIVRSNLDSVVLQLLTMNLNIRDFDFMDRPDQKAMDCALAQLELLEAVTATDETECGYQLTPLGEQMTTLPVNPKYARALIAAAHPDFGCLKEMLTVIAMLTVDSVLTGSAGKTDEVSEKRAKFESHQGDHQTLVNIYDVFKSTPPSGRNKFCQEHYLHARHLNNAMEVRKQLKSYCSGLGLKMSSCGANMDPLRRALVHGLFMNAAELQPDGNYVALSNRHTVFVHPSSVMFNRKAPYVIYTDLTETTKRFMQLVTAVEPDWLFDAGHDYFRK